MNKIIADSTQLGGMPANLNDIEFWQNAVIDSIKGLARAHNLGDTFITSGMVFTESLGFLTHTAGYVLLDGEVCQVDALGGPGLTIAGNFIYLEAIETTDPTGFKLFREVGVGSKDTYLIRKAKLTAYGSAQPGKTLYSDLKSTVEDDAWHSISPTLRASDNLGATVAGGIYNISNNNLKYFRKGKVLHAYGSIVASVLAGVNNIEIQLPLALQTGQDALGIGSAIWGGTSNISVQMSIQLHYTGAGSPLTINKPDFTAFGAQATVAIRYAIPIYIYE